MYSNVVNGKINEWRKEVRNEWMNKTKTRPKSVAEIKPTLKIVNSFLQTVVYKFWKAYLGCQRNLSMNSIT